MPRSTPAASRGRSFGYHYHYHYDFGPGLLLYAFVWLLLFGLVAAATMARASRSDRERKSTRPSDLTLRAHNSDPGGDGRRWRNGGP